MNSGLRKYKADSWIGHPVDNALHFFHNIFHTSFHSMIGLAYVAFVAFSMVVVVLGSTTSSLSYIDGVTNEMFFPRIAQANHQSANTGTTEPTGHIEVANTTTISGWALDPKAVSTSISVRLYVRAAGSSAVTYVGEFPANLSRSDLSSTLGLPNNDSATRHGFSIRTPSTVKNGDTVILYAVNTNGWNPSIGEKVIGSGNESTIPVRLFGSTQQSSGVSGGSSSAGSGDCRLNPAVMCSPADGGPGCMISEKTCRDRLDACSQGRGANNGLGFCDGSKYTFCMKAGVTDQYGRLDEEACHNKIIDACKGKPLNECDVCHAAGIKDDAICKAAYDDASKKPNGEVLWLYGRGRPTIATTSCQSGYAVKVNEGIGSMDYYECRPNPNPPPCNPSYPGSCTPPPPTGPTPPGPTPPPAPRPTPPPTGPTPPPPCQTRGSGCRPIDPNPPGPPPAPTPPPPPFDGRLCYYQGVFRSCEGLCPDASGNLHVCTTPPPPPDDGGTVGRGDGRPLPPPIPPPDPEHGQCRDERGYPIRCPNPIQRVCEHAAPPEGCRYELGPNYDGETNCAVELICDSPPPEDTVGRGTGRGGSTPPPAPTPPPAERTPPAPVPPPPDDNRGDGRPLPPPIPPPNPESGECYSRGLPLRGCP